MARSFNVRVSSENDGTLRNNVPDRLVHVAVDWVDNAGALQTHSSDYYLLPQLQWLIQNHPDDAQRLLHELVIRIVRLRLGVDT